jgi:hypothetical protein
MKHSVKHLWFPKAAVETVAEFLSVAGKMFGADAMMDTPDIALYISDQSMDPGQDLRRFLPRTGHQPLMTETGGNIQEAVALPTIGLDHRLGGQALLHQDLDLCATDSGHQRMAANPGLSAGVSTATTTLALPVAPRPCLPGLGAPK